MAQRRPWYGVVYYLLGAQGSFFAWILAIFGFFVSWSEALLFAANPRPHATTVAAVLADPPLLRRWVEMRGVEVDLLRLARFAGDRTGQPAWGEAADTDRDVVVLVDPTEPAAARLREQMGALRALEAELTAALGRQRRYPAEVHQRVLAMAARLRDEDAARRARPFAPPRLPRASLPRQLAAGLAEVRALRRAFAAAITRQDAVLMAIDERLLALASDLAEGRLWPARALVVIPDAAARARAEPEPQGDAALRSDSLSGLVARWRGQVDRRLRRLKAAVRLEATLEGMLTPLPRSRIDAPAALYGVEVAEASLSVSHRPNETAFLVGLSATVMLGLLSVGLLALSAPAEPARGAAPSGEPGDAAGARSPAAHLAAPTSSAAGGVDAVGAGDAASAADSASAASAAGGAGARSAEPVDRGSLAAPGPADEAGDGAIYDLDMSGAEVAPARAGSGARAEPSGDRADAAPARDAAPTRRALRS